MAEDDNQQLTDYLHKEVQGLRDHVDRRLQGIERWIERVTDAIDKITEYQKQTAINETEIQNLKAEVQSLKETQTNTKHQQEDLSRIFFKIAFVASVVGVIGSIVIGPVLKSVIENYFGM